MSSVHDIDTATGTAFDDTSGDRVACALGCTTRDGAPFPAPAGYQLCDRCDTRLRDMIGEIVDRYQLLLDLPADLPATPPAQRRMPGYRSTPPGDVHIMALRDVRTVAVEPGDPRSALEVLHGWATIVRRWQGSISAGNSGAVTVETEAASLLFHWDALIRDGQPHVLAQLATELAEVRGQLRAVTDDESPRAVIGYCTRDLTDTHNREYVCATPLRLPASGTTIRCGDCRATYDGDALISLALQDISGIAA